MNKQDAETLAQVLPFLRTLMAFIVRVRIPSASVVNTYAVADEYLSQLKKDLPE